MRVTFAAMVLALTLAGCGSGGGDAQETRSIRASNPHSDQLKGLSELNRGMGLRRAVRDTGQHCKKVEATGYQQEYKNLALWTLRCTDGDYGIFIAPSGDVQVRSCQQMQALGLPQCRLPAKPS